MFYLPQLVSYASSHGYSVFYLLGGDAGHQVKLPHPMYYIP